MAEASGIRAVFWDFGGVITSSPFEAFNRFETERGLPRDFIRRVNSTNADANAWAKLERSQVDAGGFAALFSEESAALGHRIDGHEVLALLAGDLRPEMVGALDCVRARFKTACLTNNAGVGEGPGMQADPARARAIAEVMTRFDLVIESSKVGVRKPEPRFYEMACENSGVAPREAVFLDDLGINLKPAGAMGMTTIKVVDPGQALRELSDALGLDLAG